MFSIEEAIKDDKLLDSVSDRRLAGLANMYLVERVGVPDFTSDRYNASNNGCLGEYRDSFDIVLLSNEMRSFWQKVSGYYRTKEPKDQFKSLRKFRGAIGLHQASLEYELDPERLYFMEVFPGRIAIEEDPQEKVRWQLLELKMFSTIPTFRNLITGKFQEIDDTNVPSDLTEAYETAEFYFHS